MVFNILTGNINDFAIESSISQAYASPGQRALGFFILHIGEKSYGVRAPDATLLACSLDAVQQRINRRGAHRMGFIEKEDALQIAEAVLSVMYGEEEEGAMYFGLSPEIFHRALISSDAVWAPDGDAAFDDGGHVLQFDVGDQVRLIAFMNPARCEDVFSSLTELWLSAEEFYGCLDKWQHQFKLVWKAALEGNQKKS